MKASSASRWSSGHRMRAAAAVRCRSRARNSSSRCDAVVPAIGQESDWACLTAECACKLSDWGTMKVDRLTFADQRSATSLPAATRVTGPRTVIEAMAHGKQAAISIGRYIQGEDLTRRPRAGSGTRWRRFRTEGYDRIPREHMPRLCPRKSASTEFRRSAAGLHRRAGAKPKRRSASTAGFARECYQCVDACLANAVVHEEQAEEREIQVGAIIVAPGFQPFNPSNFDTYAYSQASQRGHLHGIRTHPVGLRAHHGAPGAPLRPQGTERASPGSSASGRATSTTATTGTVPGCAACTPSRKRSSPRNMRAASWIPPFSIMDMRTHGKDFERYYNRAKDEHGVRFIRSRVHSVEPVAGQR